MTGCWTPRHSAVQDTDPAEHRRAQPKRNAINSANSSQRGGSVIATHETSLYDEWGENANDFGLADLFGVKFAGRVEGRMQNAYLRLEHDCASKRHPLLTGLEDAPRIINGVARVEVRPHDQIHAIAADAHSDLSRFADGEGLPARSEDGCAAGVPARVPGRRALSSIFRGTSTGLSGKCSASTISNCCAMPSSGRRTRTACRASAPGRAFST